LVSLVVGRAAPSDGGESARVGDKLVLLAELTLSGEVPHS
jgi:hypothetical protein